MLQQFDQYGYLGIFAALIAAAFGFPIPEELPVITAGILVGHEDTKLSWYIMLPVVMAGVVIGDAILYGTGRIWGRHLLNLRFVRRNFVPVEKQEKIEKNFAERGIWVLLGARLLPGIRAPVFIMAGVLKVPLGRFLLADAIYAIPLVNILFWLSYFLTDQVLVIFNKINEYRPLVVVGVLSAIAGALIQKYILSRPVSTGEPPHVPAIIAKPAVAVGHAVEKAVEKMTGRHHDKPTEEGSPDGAAEQEFGIRTEDPPGEQTEGGAGERGASLPTPEPAGSSTDNTGQDQKSHEAPPSETNYADGKVGEESHSREATNGKPAETMSAEKSGT